jgi:hypothetical protein
MGRYVSIYIRSVGCGATSKSTPSTQLRAALLRAECKIAAYSLESTDIAQEITLN